MRIIAGFGFKLKGSKLANGDKFSELYELIEDSVFNRTNSKYGFCSINSDILVGWFQTEDDFENGIKFTAIDKVPDQETIGQVVLKVLGKKYGYLLDPKTFGYYRGDTGW